MRCPARPVRRVEVPVVFFLLKLKPGVSSEDYERWVREVDYPLAKGLGSIVDYRNHRLGGPLEAGAPAPSCDYLERVEVTDLEAYRRDLESPEGRELGRQWAGFVGEHAAWTGEEVEP
jgi:hypothetical protein